MHSTAQTEGITTTKTDRALELARRAHEGQFRATDGTPYIDHPMEVAELVRDAGFGEDVQAAAFLHDVLERSDVTATTLEEEFGARVAMLVAALTEDPGPPDYRRRKQAHRSRIAAAGRDAAAVFAADKVSNARALRESLTADRDYSPAGPTGTPPADKLWHYEETLHLLEEVQPDLALLPPLREELDGLRTALEERR